MTDYERGVIFTWEQQQRDWVAEATPYERASMLHYVLGYSPRAFSIARNFVENERVARAEATA